MNDLINMYWSVSCTLKNFGLYTGLGVVTLFEMEEK